MIKEVICLEYEKFEQEIISFFENKKSLYPIELYQAMEYALFSGGKRIRPILVNLSADFLGINRTKVGMLAIALELVHCYSLIHDDLPAMDNDDFRRGKPTCHKVFGEAMAILAGDALLNLAYEVLFETVSCDNKLFVSATLLSNYAGAEGMIGGQAEELSSLDLSKETILNIYRKKTGRLIKASVLLPAYLHTNEPIYDDLSSFGEKIGLIFQLTDDVIDKAKPEKSFVNIVGEQQTLSLLEELRNDIHILLEKYGQRAKILLEFTDYIIKRIK